MQVTKRTSTTAAVPVRRRTPLLLLVAAPLLLVLAACGSSQAASKTDSGSNQTSTASKGGVTLTISPSSGPVGTAVDVRLAGVPANTGFGVVSFKDSTGAFGEDELTTDYVVDTRTLGEGGSLHLFYTIPANVLVIASPGAQSPNKKTPTTAGPGAIVLSVAMVELEVPFTIVSGPEGSTSDSSAELEIPSAIIDDLP